MRADALDPRSLFIGLVVLCAAAVGYVVWSGAGKVASVDPPSPRVAAVPAAVAPPTPFDAAGPRAAEPPAPAAAAVAEPVRVDGRWAGSVNFGASVARFVFDFQTVSGRLTGAATFPIGQGTIQDGKLSGNRLSFTTLHRKPDGQDLLSRFEGEVSGREIALDMETQGSVNRVTVYLASP